MSNVVVVAYDLPNAGYTAAAGAAFQRQVIDRLTAIPGVRGVAESSVTPLSGQHAQTAFGFPGTGVSRYFEFSTVTPSYFDVLHIPMLRGRNFTAAEVESERAVIVTESTARRLWPGADPLGQVLTVFKTDYPVVGVVRDAQVSRLGRTDTSYIFLPAGPPASHAERQGSAPAHCRPPCDWSRRWESNPHGALTPRDCEVSPRGFESGTQGARSTACGQTIPHPHELRYSWSPQGAVALTRCVDATAV